MLTNIKISNYLLIEELELDLHSGLTVVTGETGSGKSIIVDALMLIFGARGSSEVILQGKNQATFSASFELTNIDAKHYLQDNDLVDPDANEQLICRRIIDSNGKSKSYINGTSVTLTQIRCLGEFLLDIHTQHASITLLNPEVQRRLLDEYIGVSDKVAQLSVIYKNIQTIKSKLNVLSLQANELAIKEQELREKINEIEQLDLKLNEWADLENEHKELSNTDVILSELDAALRLLELEDESLVDLVGAVQTSLNRIVSYMPKLEEQLGILESIATEIREVSHGINAIANGVEQDPKRLAVVSERIEQIFDLSRKYRVNPEDLYSMHITWGDELTSLSKDTDNQLLEAELNKEISKYNELANFVSGRRKQGAIKLSKAVTELLHQLALTGEFCIHLEPLNMMSSYGLEGVEYLVSFNKGVESQALSKAISGGELSRTALALYLLLSMHNPPEVIIFDEIDVGIGGRVASIVGEMLYKLGQSKQVICITHQPQSASYGNNHLMVSKTQGKNTTHTDASYVMDDLRVKEIARMLGGMHITETTLSHAKEMLLLPSLHRE